MAGIEMLGILIMLVRHLGTMSSGEAGNRGIWESVLQSQWVEYLQLRGGEAVGTLWAYDETVFIGVLKCRMIQLLKGMMELLAGRKDEKQNTDRLL